MPIKKKTRRDRLGERNDSIREKFRREWEKGYRTDKIIAELVVSEHLDATTLEAIVFRKGVYKEF